MKNNLRTKSSNNRIGGLLMILTLVVLMMTANSAITAQTVKNELLGTWRGADSSRKMATFTADEVTFYYDLTDLDEGRGPGLEEEKFKYTHLSNNEIKLTSDGKISQTKITLEGEVLTVINDKGVKVRYMRDLQGTWVLVDDPKVKIVFTASEVAFKSLGVNGIYTRLSNNVIRVEAKGEVLLVQFTFEGEVLKMTVAQGSTKYKREWANATNSNANANTTAQTAPIDSQKFKELSTLSGHSGWVQSVAFSPDGKTLASGSWDKTAKLWNVADGKELRTLSGHSYLVSSVAFSPDGKTLASASFGDAVKLWNVADGKELRTLSGNSDLVSSVAFSPDGKTLASGGMDMPIKLWNVADGKELSTLSGHSQMVYSVAFSPDGKTLASGSGDRTVKLWRVE